MGDLFKEENGTVVVSVEGEGGNGKEEKEKDEDEERLLGSMARLDFDMLCSTVAQGNWRLLDNEEDGLASAGEFGGGSVVLRMWEGGVIDCFEDRRIAIESVCCPCYRFGINVKRAGLGSCLLPGIIHLIFALAATVSAITFVVTGRHHFLYLSVLLTISLGTYMGYHRSRIRKKLNIRGSDSNVDDCIYHLACPCCSLCQEARTLEMNNVQDGAWRGRGDTVCIGNMNDGNKISVELNPPSHLSMIT